MADTTQIVVLPAEIKTGLGGATKFSIVRFSDPVAVNGVEHEEALCFEKQYKSNDPNPVAQWLAAATRGKRLALTVSVTTKPDGGQGLRVQKAAYADNGTVPQMTPGRVVGGRPTDEGMRIGNCLTNAVTLATACVRAGWLGTTALDDHAGALAMATDEVERLVQRFALMLYALGESLPNEAAIAAAEAQAALEDAGAVDA